MREVDHAARASASAVAGTHVAAFFDAVRAEQLKKAVSRRTVVCAFLSQPKEMDTAPLLDHLWNATDVATAERSFDVFVPHVVSSGDGATRGGQMVFVEAKDAADVAANFPEQGKMKLRELTVDAFAAAVPIAATGGGVISGAPRRIIDAAAAPQHIDAMLVPGVAFSAADGSRLGRGGGFYDEFLRALRVGGSPTPAGDDKPSVPVVGFGYPEQIVVADAHTSPLGEFLRDAAGALDAPYPLRIPFAEHDERVTHVVLPTGVHACGTGTA
jgi:5-formyltetrahydrofolate cyclo-ligase